MPSTSVASTAGPTAEIATGDPHAHWLNRAPLNHAGEIVAHPAFCLLRPDRGHAVQVLPAIRVERGAEEDALRRWVDGLAGVIARAPTPSFNFVDTWSAARAR